MTQNIPSFLLWSQGYNQGRIGHHWWRTRIPWLRRSIHRHWSKSTSAPYGGKENGETLKPLGTARSHPATVQPPGQSPTVKPVANLVSSQPIRPRGPLPEDERKRRCENYPCYVCKSPNYKSYECPRVRNPPTIMFPLHPRRITPCQCSHRKTGCLWILWGQFPETWSSSRRGRPGSHALLHHYLGSSYRFFSYYPSIVGFRCIAKPDTRRFGSRLRPCHWAVRPHIHHHSKWDEANPRQPYCRPEVYDFRRVTSRNCSRCPSRQQPNDSGNALAWKSQSRYRLEAAYRVSAHS